MHIIKSESVSKNVHVPRTIWACGSQYMQYYGYAQYRSVMAVCKRPYSYSIIGNGQHLIVKKEFLKNKKPSYADGYIYL